MFYENFKKEVTQATIKYNPYRWVAYQILEHKCPTYEEWVKRYILIHDSNNEEPPKKK